jgi:hypothetical protein
MLLDWYADDRLYVELASDPNCPKSLVFLDLLRRRTRQACADTQDLLDLEALGESSWTGGFRCVEAIGANRARSSDASALLALRQAEP